jgi:hypothetical protein
MFDEFFTEDRDRIREGHTWMDPELVKVQRLRSVGGMRGYVIQFEYDGWNMGDGNFIFILQECHHPSEHSCIRALPLDNDTYHMTQNPSQHDVLGYVLTKQAHTEFAGNFHLRLSTVLNDNKEPLWYVHPSEFEDESDSCPITGDIYGELS